MSEEKQLYGADLVVDSLINMMLSMSLGFQAQKSIGFLIPWKIRDLN